MGKKYSQEEIFEKLKTILVDDFEIAPEKLTLDANYYSATYVALCNNINSYFKHWSGVLLRT